MSKKSKETDFPIFLKPCGWYAVRIISAKISDWEKHRATLSISFGSDVFPDASVWAHLSDTPRLWKFLTSVDEYEHAMKAGKVDLLRLPGKRLWICLKIREEGRMAFNYVSNFAHISTTIANHQGHAPGQEPAAAPETSETPEIAKSIEGTKNDGPQAKDK